MHRHATFYPAIFLIIGIAGLLPGAGLPAVRAGERQPPTPSPQPASLTWTKPTVELQAKLGETGTLEARYPFRNTGADSVDVLTLHSDCGCTVLDLAKRHYGPGESGELKVKFTVGDRTGRQEKHILVESSDRKDPTALTLVVKLPEMMRLNPGTLGWSQGEDKAAKTIAIEAGEGYTIKEIMVASSQALFHPTVRVVEAGRRYELSVTPERTDLPLLAQLPITCTFDDAAATKKTFTAYATIKAQ